MTWTHFYDMCSGGGQKEKWQHIFIEAPKDEAYSVFYARFGHNPNRVTCTCCGPDYAYSESESLAQATAYERGCDYAYFGPDGEEVPKEEAWASGVGLRAGYCGKWVERADRGDYACRKYRTVAEYLKDPTAKVIYAEEIQSEERFRDVPEQGYVWQD